MDPKIIRLFDEYTHTPLSRAVFIKRLSQIVGSVAAAYSILPLLESNYSKSVDALSQTDDLVTETISYEGVGGTMSAFVARPKAQGKYPTVVVIHENRGLTPHIRDVTLRMARAGFLAVAPDALAVVGGYPGDEDEARKLFQTLNQSDSQQNFVKTLQVIEEREDWNGNTGCVGFCWGGAMAGYLATEVSDLKAAVAFYGRQPSLEHISKIKAALQLHYAALDERVNAGIPDFIAAMDEHDLYYELYMYEDVHHAFHNDTSVSRYNEPAAKLAWSRTVDFLNTHLQK